MNPPSLFRFIACVVALLVWPARDIRAQCAFASQVPVNNCGKRLGEHESSRGRYFAINSAIGGATAAIASRVRGGPFWSAFARGAIGGSVVYLGKLTVSGRSPTAGLLGRPIAAVGSSVVRNASLKQSALSEIVFPLGPLRIYVRTKDSLRSRLRLDLAGSIGTIYAATRPHSHFDANASLRALAPVFLLQEVTRGEPWQGRHIAGVIQVQEDPDLLRRSPALQRQRTAAAISHELVHVTQYDFSYIAWTQAGESALLRRVRGGRKIFRFIDLSLNVPVWLGANALISSDKRPWEWEANAIAR